MINKEYFYAVSCDICKEVIEGPDGIDFWADMNTAYEMANDCDCFIQFESKEKNLPEVAICDECLGKHKLATYNENDDDLVITHQEFKKLLEKIDNDRNN